MSIVYLVATGEVVGGLETYTRHDARPPLCDAEVLHTTSTDDLCDFLRQEGYAEGRYDQLEEDRAEVLRELLEWESGYLQQARGGDRSGHSDARADAVREIHDHLRSSWATRDKAHSHTPPCLCDRCVGQDRA